MDYQKLYYQANKERFYVYYNKKKLKIKKCESCDREYINLRVRNQSKKHMNKENIQN